MQVHRFTDANQFYQRVKDYLLHQEALHNLLLGMCNELMQNSGNSEELPYLATVEQEDNIVVVAMKKPSGNLVLSPTHDIIAIDLLTEDLYLSFPSLPGVIAPTSESDKFVLAWHLLTNQAYKLKLALRAFQLEKVQQIPSTTGYLRQAVPEDKELLVSWGQAFALEALGETMLDAELWAERILRKRKAYLWQDEVAVSIACGGKSTPNGARINTVYTPPEYRRRGYASASVAALSQSLLNQGNQFCFLFTDLANPTSNHIYQDIGYQPVGDWHQYSFS
ncbi:GNAT family N-acetyltransferase [Anabaena azotica]|uniref:GNAT family N-acetyltransferase n=1 Tax=Anabaena azotica FACHB-119 TaxID=947527 RepID=A0ABR8CY02_9NOST|nr:GNAT family N-acetyltransferase [Anabaena azotica]MBD2499697.1 GNAT family N-acetyltransferase [Anabaena azotica FACHB-119]